MLGAQAAQLGEWPDVIGIQAEEWAQAVNDHVQVGSGWGEYQPYIGDALECCVDHVGRLQRSIEGEIPSDRHYFVEKASALKEWATILLARCEEVEGWIESDMP